MAEEGEEGEEEGEEEEEFKGLGFRGSGFRKSLLPMPPFFWFWAPL